MENREKEIFDETLEKQAKLVKKVLLGTLCGIGLVFAILGIVFSCVEEATLNEISIIYLIIGFVLILLGIILFFTIPTKYNYEKYKARVKKYGIMNMFELSAKIAELEERIKELEERR